MPNDAKVVIEVLEPDKRPVSAVADHTEFRDVIKVEVMEESGIDILMMFDPGHTLAERILSEQFGDRRAARRAPSTWVRAKRASEGDAGDLTMTRSA